jgi:hypothetical protein
MSDTLRTVVAHVPFWVGYALSIGTIVIGWIYLHEAKPLTSKWFARSFVYALGAVGVIVSFLQQINSQELIRLLSEQQRSTMSEIRAQSRALREQQIRSAQATRREADLAAQLRLESATTRRAEIDLQASRKRVAAIVQQTDALGRDSRDATLASHRASALARATVLAVQRNGAQTARRIATAEKSAHFAAADANRRLNRAESLASAAALKGNVFELPPFVTIRIASALSRVAPGTAFIACAPGLETVCLDLSKPFRDAGWKTIVRRGAAFFTGGGLDAEAPDSDPNTGIYVWYRSDQEQLAAALAAAIVLPGVRAVTRRDQGVDPTTISISVLFVVK